MEVLGQNDLSIEQIKALGSECLSHELMKSEKITIIGYMLSADNIKKIGPERLAEITITELNKIV
ncbi:MAG: hypothetical protein QM490_05645 [Candidatus Gracilibacteria bacterium]